MAEISYLINEMEIENLKKIPLDEVWIHVGNLKIFNDEYLFPNSGKLAKIVMTLPHSNVEADRIFFIVTDIKIKKEIGEDTLKCNVIRNSLHPDNKTCVNYPITVVILKRHKNKDICSLK